LDNQALGVLGVILKVSGSWDWIKSPKLDVKAFETVDTGALFNYLQIMDNQGLGFLG
jgi:hypothetical protein